jgi:EmrB/QacA subfamily drug resistance transporter
MQPAPSKTPWTILVLLAVAQFMVILDITIVNVALPSIGEDLGFAAGDLQWVVTAYVLFTGGLLLLGGRAADLLGRREVFLTGLLLFTAASLASGLAPSPEALVIARSLQGLGAALLSPAALSIITTTYTGAQRGTALSVWGAMGAGGAAAGVLFGGMLTTWLSWEWVFFINVPVGLVTAVLVGRLVGRAPRAGGLRQLDLPGAVSLVGGLMLLVYALQGTGEHGWASARTLVLLAVAGTLLATFAAIERGVARPLVPPRTWRERPLVSSAALMLGLTGIMIGAFFLNSIYLQRVLDASALETGLAFLPFVLAIAPAAHLGPALLVRAGARVVSIAGLGLVAVGAFLLAAAPDDASYATDLLPGFLVLGVGLGLVIVTVQVTAMTDVGHATAGLASGLMTTSHEIGAALGVAVLSAVALGAAGDTQTPAGFAGGYEDGFLVAAFVAVGLALLALRVVPAVRPDPAAAHAAAH